MADNEDAETLLPLLLDRYRVEGRLGEGGLGTVIKAYDTRLKHLVAICLYERKGAGCRTVFFFAHSNVIHIK